MGRTGKDSKQYATRPIPRGVDQGPIASTMGVGSTSNTIFEYPKPSPTIGEREDVARQRYASSATNTHDGLRQERQRIKADNFLPEEGAQASRHFNVTHRGSRAGADPSYRVPPPPPPITGRDRDRVSASALERDRHKSYANIDTPSSIPASSSSATHSPGYAAPVNVPPVSAIISTMKSVSFDDSGEQSNSSPHGRNGPSRAQVSYTRPSVPPPSNIRPTATKKSVSFDSGVQPSTSLKDRNRPSDMQDPYARHGVPPPSSSRPIVPQKSVSFDSVGFQPSSSREGWAGPSRLPYETYHEPSQFSETPKEAPQSWQSSNRFNSQHSSLDIAIGNPYYPVQPTDMHHKVSEGEYHQTLSRSGNEAQRREVEMRR